MMITIGALMLLSLVILRVNTGNLNTHEVLIDSKVQILATSLANSIIEEAFTKEFDEYNVLYPAELLSNLTPVTSLGKDAGETYPNFDDMDDFNGLYIHKNIPGADNYEISSIVEYVNPANPGITSSIRTWDKKITVKVTCRGMLNRNGIQDTIKMSSVRSYWYF